tara:strand:- start:7300 stop:7566 length:267 start_codon:yes stop_codon:yes gene_type:complete
MKENGSVSVGGSSIGGGNDRPSSASFSSGVIIKFLLGFAATEEHRILGGQPVLNESHALADYSFFTSAKARIKTGDIGDRIVPLSLRD